MYCPKCGKPAFILEDGFWKCSRIECGFRVTHHNPDCDICEIGQRILEDLRARRAKEITFIEHQRRVKKIGEDFCFNCRFNGIKGKKRWAIKKLNANFQAWDYFDEIHS